MPSDEFLKPDTSRAQLHRREFTGPGSGAIDQIGDADAAVNEVPPVLIGHRLAAIKITIDDAGQAQRGIETIARVREVSLCGGGPQAWVDADEEQLQAGAN
jgi:hypothetical protein